MSKLSFAELAKKADSIVSEDLLNTIAGGLAKPFNECHTDNCHLHSATASPASPLDTRSSN